jgi:hypothetical protein
MASVNPGFIAHEFFHRYTWLLPETHDKWYYYIPRENKNFDISYQNFSKSVDKDLKELVEFLHSKKMATTPSCAGHFHKPSEYYKVYKLLKEDEEKIKEEGMFFFDYEKGKYYFVRDEDYKIPFEPDEFIIEGVDYQKKGVVGITSKNKENFDILKELKHENFNKKIDGDIVIFTTHAENEKQNKNNWKSFTDLIKKSF